MFHTISRSFVEVADGLKGKKFLIICNDDSKNVVILTDGTALRSINFIKDVEQNWFVLGHKYEFLSEIFPSSSNLLMSRVAKNVNEELRIYRFSEIVRRHASFLWGQILP